jgi:hypothetical protein
MPLALIHHLFQRNMKQGEQRESPGRDRWNPSSGATVCSMASLPYCFSCWCSRGHSWEFYCSCWSYLHERTQISGQGHKRHEKRCANCKSHEYNGVQIVEIVCSIQNLKRSECSTSIDPLLVSEKYEESRVSRKSWLKKPLLLATRDEAQAKQLQFAPCHPCTTACLLFLLMLPQSFLSVLLFLQPPSWEDIHRWTGAQKAREKVKLIKNR